jgi:FIST N domain.
MTTEFGTGIAKGENSFEVGKLAAQQAISKIKREVNLSIVFSSSKYNYNEVVKGVRAITDAPLIGCSTAGEFTEKKWRRNR